MRFTRPHATVLRPFSTAALVAAPSSPFALEARSLLRSNSIASDLSAPALIVIRTWSWSASAVLATARLGLAFALLAAFVVFGFAGFFDAITEPLYGLMVPRAGSPLLRSYHI